MYPQSRQVNTSSMNFRLNTGLRAPTGYKATNISNGLQTRGMGLLERPVTQQGVSGLQTNLAGPKRRVFDKSYYLQAMRKKIEGLTEEIAKMRQTKEKREKEKEVQKKMEERKNKLQDEVRGLEAKLADLNLAMDKHRAGTHKSDLENIRGQIAFQNKRLTSQLDSIFVQKKNFEEQLDQITKREEELNELSKLKIKELGPKAVEQHQKLSKDILRLKELIISKRSELEDISFKVYEQEQSLKSDSNRGRFFTMKEVLEKLQNQREEKKEKLTENKLTFPELRDKLLERVKFFKSKRVTGQTK